MACWLTEKDKERYSSRVSFISSGKDIPEFTSNSGYKYENEDCYSWSIPQAVGMYSLILQQNPNLNWEDYAKIAFKTSKLLENGVRLAQPQKIFEMLNIETKSLC